MEYLQVGFISWHQPRRWADFAGEGGKSISIGKYALARRFFYFRINGWRGYVREALQGMFD